LTFEHIDRKGRYQQAPDPRSFFFTLESASLAMIQRPSIATIVPHEPSPNGHRSPESTYRQRNMSQLRKKINYRELKKKNF
jgi:hypothetical protein